mmetsp:Transcript_15610/g.35863  ORF Transcript_15610/g.35863 Transcript_15610/m.35863 type:complete len:220 (-) Transcript_15610:1165-1824(-)
MGVVCLAAAANARIGISALKCLFESLLFSTSRIKADNVIHRTRWQRRLLNGRHRLGNRLCLPLPERLAHLSRLNHVGRVCRVHSRTVLGWLWRNITPLNGLRGRSHLRHRLLRPSRTSHARGGGRRTQANLCGACWQDLTRLQVQGGFAGLRWPPIHVGPALMCLELRLKQFQQIISSISPSLFACRPLRQILHAHSPTPGVASAQIEKHACHIAICSI